MIDPAFLIPMEVRGSLRRGVRLRCELVDERAFRLVGRRALDLSPDGMLVECDTRGVTVGDPLLLSFRAPGTALWLDTTARVARVVRGRRPGDRGRCLGLSFDGLTRAERTLLAESLRGVPPPIPARAIRRDYAETIRRIAA